MGKDWDEPRLDLRKDPEEWAMYRLNQQIRAFATGSKGACELKQSMLREEDIASGVNEGLDELSQMRQEYEDTRLVEDGEKPLAETHDGETLTDAAITESSMQVSKRNSSIF